MWGLLMAAIRLELEPVPTRLCGYNHEGHLPSPATGRRPRPWLHYCYANPGFDKRAFDGDLAGPGSAWAARRAAPGSANALLFEAIEAAARFYGIGASGFQDCEDDPM
jgi:hypothetical protein